MTARRSREGFTLVEVLVASTILFSVFGAATLAYRVSLRSVQAAENHLWAAEALPFAISEIRGHLFGGEESGEGAYGAHVRYRWRAKVSESARNRLDPEFVDGQEARAEGPFLLRLVSVSVSFESPPGRAVKTVEYTELVWSRA